MDIVERLRSVGGIEGTMRWYINPDGPEAADYIEQLRKENQKQALDFLASEGEWWELIGKKDKEIEQLREALDQVLDDMGAEGRSVCEATKAQARYALGNNVDPEFDYYSLDRAISVLVSIGQFPSVEEARAALKEGE